MTFAQPVTRAITVTSDANGNASGQFDSVPQGQVWTGAIAVQGAPGTAQLTALVTGRQWGTWTGPAPSAPVQAADRDTIGVQAVGLAPSMAYVVSFDGTASSPDAAPAVWPSSSAGAIPTAGNKLGNAALPGGGGLVPVAFTDADTGVAIVVPAHQSLVLYTAEIVQADLAAEMSYAIERADNGFVVFQSAGAHAPPAFGYFGGFVLPPGVSLQFRRSTGGPSNNAAAQITYQLVPA